VKPLRPVVDGDFLLKVKYY